MTPEQVADAVFGAWTREAPLPRWMGGGTCAYSWGALFDGPKPDWYVEPYSDAPTITMWNWTTAIFG